MWSPLGCGGREFFSAQAVNSKHGMAALEI
jgi:hypothetical protein